MAFDPSLVTSAFAIQDGFQTTLSNSINATDLAIPLAILPTGVEGTLVIDPGTVSEEEIYFTSLGTGVVNCPSTGQGRGVNSTAIAHNSGAPVKMLVTKAYLDGFKYIAMNAVSNLGTDGWTIFNHTLTFASADAPTYTATTPTDVTSSYTIGMKFKMTNNSTVQYFFLTKISYSVETGLTTFTFLGGGTAAYYELQNSAITNVYYSTAKCPNGFRIDKDFWTTFILGTSVKATVSPTASQYYMAETIVAPIGEWDVYVSCLGTLTYGSTSWKNFQLSLSTNNAGAPTNTKLSTYELVATGTSSAQFPSGFSGRLSIKTKTPYYLNYMTTNTSISNLGLLGDVQPTIIELTCAYL